MARAGTIDKPQFRINDRVYDLTMNMTSLKTRFKFSAPLLHALTDFWSWWIAELSGMLPKSVRTALLPRVERLYLQPNGTELTTRRDTGESIQETGCYPLSATALRPEQIGRAHV